MLAAGLAWWWLAGRVLVKVAYLLMRWLFGLAVLAVRGDQLKDAELLMLAHENAVLRRHAGRVRHEPGGRAQRPRWRISFRAAAGLGSFP